MGFLDNYETVNMKVKRLHATFPTNRIETSIIDWQPEKGFILIECRIYRHSEDEKPAAIDYAHGMVGGLQRANEAMVCGRYGQLRNRSLCVGGTRYGRKAITGEHGAGRALAKGFRR